MTGWHMTGSYATRVTGSPDLGRGLLQGGPERTGRRPAGGLLGWWEGGGVVR